jgi:hypothetical protein
MEVFQPAAPETGLRARVVVDSLNIRSGPAVTYADIGDQVKGAVRNILHQRQRSPDASERIDPARETAVRAPNHGPLVLRRPEHGDDGVLEDRDATERKAGVVAERQAGVGTKVRR